VDGFNDKKWGDSFLKELFNNKAQEFQRKLSFEVLSLYLRDSEGCKDLLLRVIANIIILCNYFFQKEFMGNLINAFMTEKQPLFQLKITVLLVKIALRQPTEVFRI